MSTPSQESKTDPFMPPDGWSLSRSMFKALCWALDGLLVFSIAMIVFETALKQWGVSTDLRYALTSLNTAIAHQIIYPAIEHLQTLTTKRAIPKYRGNWWLNFIVADHLSNEGTAFIVVGGIQALFAVWVIDSAFFSNALLMLLDPVTFFLWSFAEDGANKFILGRESEAEDHQHTREDFRHRVCASFRWSIRRLLRGNMLLYNLISIAIKAASTYLTYWAGDEMLSRWAGVSRFEDAPPQMRALIAFLKTAMFFEAFLFIGIRCPDAVLEHLSTPN
jgi:hypothetical protein